MVFLEVAGAGGDSEAAPAVAKGEEAVTSLFSPLCVC